MTRGVCALLAAFAWLMTPALAQPALREIANGVLLVAPSELVDPNFARTVILVTLAEDGSALGVVLNRPLGRKVSDYFVDPALAALLPPGSDALYAGGPVARGNLAILIRTTTAPPQSLQVLDDIYLSTSPQALRDLQSESPAPEQVRFFAGYAGWAPGQLQAEVARGGWWMVRADAERIFTTRPEALWEELSRSRFNKRAGLAVNLE